MKRFILPIVLVVLGVFLILPLRLVNDYIAVRPWTHPTGVQICDTPKNESSCNEGTYQDVLPSWLFTAMGVGLWIGVVMIPSGIAIGIYRLATMKHKVPAKLTKAK